MNLEGKRLLVTVADQTSEIAFSVAALAAELGAQVLAAPAPGGGTTRASDERRSGPWELIELDPELADYRVALREQLAGRGLDCAFHPIPPDGPEQRGGGPGAGIESAASAFLRTAYSLNGVARAVTPLMRGRSQPPRSIVGLCSGEPMPGATGVVAALEAVTRYMACDLGPRGIRVNLVAAGPPPGHAGEAPGSGAPGAAARAACFLLSDWARAVSGEILRVDGVLDPGGERGDDPER